tara:strand:- start:1464 stop:1727 length:264 start_codon:yes stop_codon:yes gene_type:complete
MTDNISKFKSIQHEGLELFTKKNTDYGNAFSNYGVVGVMVRMSDKLSRYVNVSESTLSLVKDETLRDTLIDLHNYCALAIMLLDDKD